MLQVNLDSLKFSFSFFINCFQNRHYHNLIPRMLLLDIVSLNLFAFIGYPFVSLMFDGLVTDKKVFFEKRKAENVELIMRRLKKMEP